jgi:hypothetical protein
MGRTKAVLWQAWKLIAGSMLSVSSRIDCDDLPRFALGQRDHRFFEPFRSPRPGGATAKELLKTTSWQQHSLRGFISGTLGKKMGLTVTSTKGEDGERSYSIKA